MSDKFPLFQQLENLRKNPSSASPLPRGVKYEKRIVSMVNEEIAVFIPLREAQAFDQTVPKNGKYFKSEELSDLLRKHRGIRNWE